MSAPVNPSTVDPFSGHTPAEVCRRLRHASVLISSADHPGGQREAVLLRARNLLSGTLRKLDQLIAEVSAAPVSLDEQLTERRATDRIDPFP